MTKEDKIKAECDKLTAEFAKLYGDDHIIIGRTREYNYLSLPDDPKVFGQMMERLLAALLMKGLASHLEEAVEAYAKVGEKIKEGLEKLNAN